MHDEARKLAKKWVLANYREYKKSGAKKVMWEKLTTGGRPGGGGEYDVQVNGWMEDQQ